jgi:hypothetical protein
MPATTLSPQDIADLARSAAECTLGRYVVRSGGHATLHWDDATFDGYRDALAEAIRHRLAAIDDHAHAFDEPRPTRYGRCTVRYYGRPAPARHAELLPNGYWRVDFESGTVGCYDEDPIANPGARQRH